MTKPKRNKLGKEPSDYELVKADAPEKHLKSKTKVKQGKLKKDNSKKKKMLKSSVDSILIRKDSLTSNGSETTSDIEKKSQCDLCKLSYSSEKELVEHLSSLMHHTKMEDRETNPVHKCTLCVVTCKSMSDYRMHIGTDRHQRKLSILKGEEIRDNSKNKGQRHNPQPSDANTYKNWHVRRGSRGHYDFSGPHRYNKMHQSTNYGNTDSWQKHDYNFHGMEVEDSERDSYNRGRRSWQDSRGGSSYRFDQRPFKKNDAPLFEPWGSGLYSGAIENYEQSDFHYASKDFDGYRPFNRTVNYEDINDWDEHSFRQKEKFLAAFEDSYHVENKRGHLKSNQSHNDFKMARSSRQEDSVGRERKRPRHGDDIQELLPKSSKSDAPSSGENITVKDVPYKTSIFQKLDRNLTDPISLSTNASNLFRNSTKSTRDHSNVPRDPSNVSRDPSNVSRDPSNVSRDLSNVSRDPSNDSRDPSNVSRDPSNVSRDLSNVSRGPNISKVSGTVSRNPGNPSKEPSNSSNDNNSTAVSSTLNTNYSNTLRITSIDDASNNVLERAERLCKELREKREASLAEKDLIIQRQEREVLNKKMNDLNKKQESYLKGHLKDSTKFVHTTNSDSVKSSSSTLLSKLKDQTSSLTSAAQIVNKMTENVKNTSEKYHQERSQTNPKSGVELSNKELGKFERLKPADNLQPTQKPQPKPNVISKDSLQKMVNAPRSRAERLQLAKLLYSREEHKSTPTNTSRTSLQLGGLYDSTECAPETNLEGNEDATTIKLEDLPDAVRKQILDLIGGNSISDLGPGTKSNVDINVDKNKKKKKSKGKNGKNYAEATDGVPKPKRKKGESKMLTPDNSRFSVGQPVNRQWETVSMEKEMPSRSTAHEIGVNVTTVATYSPNVASFHLNKSTKLTCPNMESDIEIVLSADSSPKVTSPEKFISLDSDSDLEIHSSADSGEAVMSLSVEKVAISRCSPESIRKKSASAGTISTNTTLKLNEEQLAGNDKRTASQESKSQLTSENIMQKFPTIMSFHRPETILGQVGSLETNDTSNPISCGHSLSPIHSTPLSMAPLQQTSVSSLAPLQQTSVSSLAPLQQTSLTSPQTQKTSVPSNIQLSHPSVRLTLPPSTWLEERLSSNLSDTQTTSLPTPTTSSELLDSLAKSSIGIIPMFKSDSISNELKDPENCVLKESSMCPDQPRSGNSNERSSGENIRDVGVTDLQGESTSPAVLELLSLSEREEDIKQEMMNMDLRLTRLHKLLEQAVVQINKCTERRSQLQEESQEISNRRISLLRETAAGKLKDKTSRHGTYSADILSETSINQSLCAAEGSSGSKSSATVSSTSGDANVIHGTTLTRADWLAKFSSFLPLDTAVKRKNVSLIPSENLLDKDTMKDGSNQNLRDVEMTNDEDNYSTPIETNYLSAAGSTGAQNELAGIENTANPPALGEVTNSLFTGPIMYLGSFRSPEAPMNLRAPVIRLNGPGATTPVFKKPDNVHILCNSDDSGGEGAGHTTVFQDLPSVPKPVRSHNNQHCAGEDSDTISGASCCSIVSGSSLGEKISFYCRKNALLDKNSLSTIMSDPCDQHVTKLPEGNNINNNWSKVIKPCSVPLDRIETQHSKDISGNLDKQALRSAEALHLMERNFEESVSVCPSVVSSDSGKKKKRRTRQERDISDLRRMRRRHIIFSSSSDESQKFESPDREVKEKTGASPTRINETVSLSEKSNSDRGSERSITTLLPVSEVGGLIPARPAAVTIAACDSSTSFGLVDSEGITERIKVLKEIKSLEPSSVRRVKSSSNIPILCDSSEDEQELRRKKRDKTKPDGTSLHSFTPTFSQSGKHKVSKKSSSKFDSKSLKAFTDAQPDRDKKMSRFPGNHGSVIELQVVDESLYVAYSNFGVLLFSLLETSSEAIAHYTSSCLRCMTVVKLEGATTIVAGLGGKISFCDTQKQQKELDQVSFDMGSPVKCLLVMEHLIYLGLATGEISMFDTKKMKETDRFICCDHPIHCLASAQEGSSKLLCVASQDGTILVINASTALPLRILTGHTKTSFSLQVDGPFVYSGSGDSCVIIHNLHTGAVEHKIEDNQGLVKTVCYNNGFLFTAGMDRLVRCYDTKTRKLVQVYYGAERGVITKIIVYNNMLITGNITGAVDCVELDLKAKHRCHKGCKLKFGNKSHLFWHLLEDHNITTKN